MPEDNKKKTSNEMTHAELIAERNSKLSARVEVYVRFAKPSRSAHDLPTQAEKPKQDEDGLASMFCPKEFLSAAAGRTHLPVKG